MDQMPDGGWNFCGLASDFTTRRKALCGTFRAPKFPSWFRRAPGVVEQA